MLQEIRGSGTLTHTQNKNKTKIHTRLLQKIRGSGPLTHEQGGEIYNGTSSNIALSSAKKHSGAGTPRKHHGLTGDLYRSPVKVPKKVKL